MTQTRKSRNYTHIAGIILMVFGLAMVFEGIFGFDFFDIIFKLWPLILIYIGWRIMQRGKSSLDAQGEDSKSTENYFSEGHNETDESLSGISSFGDSSIRLTSKDFNGGSATSTIGDIHLNLSEIDFKDGEKHLKLSNTIGDMHLTCPKDIAVKIRANCIIGTVKLYSDVADGFMKTLYYRTEGYSEKEKRLYIELSTVIGDISVS